MTAELENSPGGIAVQILDKGVLTGQNNERIAMPPTASDVAIGVRPGSSRRHRAMRKHVFQPGITVCVGGQADAPPCLIVADGRGACLAAVAIVPDIGDHRAPTALAEAVDCLHGLLERGLCAENLAVLVDDVVRVRPDLTTFLQNVAGEAETAVALWPAPGSNRAPGIRPLAAPDALALDVDGYARRAAVTAVSRVDASGAQRVELCVSRRSVRVSPWIAFRDVGVAQRTADALLASITDGVSARDVAGALVASATTADAQFSDDRTGAR